LFRKMHVKKKTTGKVVGIIDFALYLKKKC